MSYKIVAFGDVDLPVLEASYEIGAGSSKLALMDVQGMVFDMDGDARADRARQTIVYNCKIFADTQADVLTQLNKYKAMRGTRDQLFRLTPSGDYEWAWARLDSITGQRGARNTRYQPLSFTFVLESDVWFGVEHKAWYLDDGHYLDREMVFDEAPFIYTLDASPKTCVTNNNSNTIQRDVIITITAGSADITAIRMTATAAGLTYDIEYTTRIVAGKSLVIDCGSRSVQNDGVGDYQNFGMTTSHESDWWFVIDAGRFSFDVTFTGGSTDSTISLQYTDAME